MVLPTDVECNKIIDQVIESRRSIRKFKPEAPAKDLIEQILQAGLLAPYAAASVSREDFRRFIVIPRESKATSQVAAILKRKAQSWSKQIEMQMQHDEFNKQHAGPFLERLKLMGDHPRDRFHARDALQQVLGDQRMGGVLGLLVGR